MKDIKGKCQSDSFQIFITGAVSSSQPRRCRSLRRLRSQPVARCQLLPARNGAPALWRWKAKGCLG